MCCCMINQPVRRFSSMIPASACTITSTSLIRRSTCATCVSPLGASLDSSFTSMATIGWPLSLQSIASLSSLRITLNIDEDLIQFAYAYAKRSNQSISSIVETYLSALKTTKENQEELNSRTKELYGIFEKSPLPNKKELRKQFHEKNIDRS